MGVVTTAIMTGAAIIGAGAAVKSTQKAGTAAKRGQRASRFATQRANERARKDKETLRDQSISDRKQRLASIARNRTMFTDPLGVGGKADTVRKILTGQ